MNDLIDFADIGPIPEPTIWTKPPMDLDALEAKITGLTPQWPLPGPAEKAMRELIEEVRKSRAAPSEVAAIVPEHCSGSAFVFDPGVLHVNKDGSGYIAIDEDDFTLEDDRCEGPDGPEGSVHWITRLPPEEMTALRDFLNGCSFATPSDDLLRQAIEALRPFATDELMEGLDDGPDEKSTSWPTFQLGNFHRARAVLTAYDKREQL